jgi:hypothetical protein
MANAVHYHARITSQQSDTTGTLTTKQTVSSTDLSGAGFANSDEVLVLWYAMVSAGSNIGTLVDLQYNGATIMSGTTTRHHYGSSGREKAFVFMGRVSLGTLADFTVKLATGTASSAVYLEKSELLIIRLSDFGTENTDWFWNKSTSVVVNTTSYSATNRAAVTWTPSTSEDWVYFAYSHTALDQTANNAEARVTLDGSLDSGDWSSEAVSTAEEWPRSWWSYLSSLSTSSHTLAMETRDDGGTTLNDHRESAIFVFRKAKWSDVYVNETGTNAVAASSDVQVATITDTLTTSQPLVIWGEGILDLGTTNAAGFLWVRENGSTVLDPTVTRTSGLGCSWSHDTTDELMQGVLAYKSSASGTLDLDLFAGHTSASSWDLLQTGLLVWGMGLAASGSASSVPSRRNQYLQLLVQ